MTAERKVGLFAALAMAVLLGAVFVIGKVDFNITGYSLKVRFKFVSGLREDAAVRYAGGPVIGQVRKLEVKDEMVIAHLRLDRNIRIRKDCEFWIYTAGLLGEQYVEINASVGGEAPYYEDGDVLRGIDPVSFDATLIRIGKMVDALAPVFGKEEVGDSMRAMVTTLSRSAKRVSALVDKHAGSLDATLGNLAAFSKSLNRMAKDLEQISANLRSISDPENPQSMRAAMVKLNASLDSLQKTGVTMEGVARKIDSGDGALAVLINDKRFAQDLKDLIKKLKDEPIRAKIRLF